MNARTPLLMVLVCAMVFLACTSVPYTKRSQLILLSQSEESSLGLQAYQEILKQSKLSTRRDWSESVRRVGQRIAAVADRPDFQWEFNLIADPQINAFALPGGKVAFYEGIMPICGNDTGVAVVMGHEVAHAIARHGGERVSQGMIAQFGAEATAAVLGGDDPKTQEMILSGLGLGLQVGVMLPFSRKHESEADRIGMILMAKAGYDPREAPKFWERMAARAGAAGTPEFLSTHPHHDTRVQQLNEWLPEALQYYKP